LLTFAASMAGCKKEETVRVYSAPKDPPPATQLANAPAMAPGMGENPALAGDAQAAGAPLTWTAPAAWKELPAGEMRYAAYLVNENPQVQFTVIPLPMEAGELLPNVNRWEHQLGLPPSPVEKLGSIVKTATVNGLDVKSVDLTGPESAAGTGAARQRMLAAMVPAGGRIWFFKMSGPVDVVAKQKENFDGFLASLKPGSASTAQADQSAKPQAAEAADSMKLSGYHAPSGWDAIPGAKAPRMIAFSMGPADAKAELVVTR